MVNPTDCDNKSDEELARMSLEDSSYFYCLMKRYEGKLAAYVTHLTLLADDDAADIIQESFIKAYRHLNDCDCDLKFSSWMYRIVHNEAVNFLKRNRKNMTVNIDEHNEEFVDWLTDGTNIEKETVEKHFREYVGTVLDRLKPEYKEVLVLKFLEGRDYLEISDILQKPMGTVATLIARAKIQFKEVYEKDKQYQR